MSEKTILELIGEEEGGKLSVDSLEVPIGDLLPKELGSSPAAPEASQAPEPGRRPSAPIGSVDVLGLNREGGEQPSYGLREVPVVRLLPELPGMVVPGASKSVAAVKFQMADIETEKLLKVKSLVERIGTANAPTAQELLESGGSTGSMYQHFLQRAMKEKDVVLAEIDHMLSSAQTKAQIARDVHSSYEADLAEKMPQDPTLVEQGLASAAQSIGPTAAAVMLAPITGPGAAMVAGAAASAASSSGESYMKQTQHGEKTGNIRSAEERAGTAAIDALAEFGGELVSLRVMLRIGQPFFKKAAEIFVAEPTSEMITSLMQSANESLSYNPDKTAKEWLEDLAVSGIAGLAGASGMAPAAGGLQKIQQKIEEDKALTAISELIASEPVGLLSPEEEAVRLLDPKTSPGARPYETPEQAFAYALKKDAARAAELAGKVQEPLKRARDLFAAGEVSQKQFADFRRAMIVQAAAQIEPDAEAAQMESEALKLEKLLRETADESYTPTADEAQELEIAKQLLTKTESARTPMETHQILMKELPRTPLGEAFRSMFPDPQGSGLSDYESWEFRNLFQGNIKNKLAQYYHTLALRQAAGIYPFAGTALRGDAPSGDLSGSFTDADGAPVDIMSTKPGAVYADISSSPELRKKSIGTLQRWLQAITPQARIGVVDSKSSISGAKPGLLGSQMVTGEGRGLIYVDETLDEAKYVETLAHEYGHFVGNYLMARMPNYVKVAVYKAWGKHARLQMKNNVQQAMIAQRGPAGAALPEESASEVVGKVITLPWAVARRVRGYLLSYEEFKAHQMERMLAGNKLDMDTHAQTFFKKYKATMQRFFDRFKSDFAPNQTFEQFVQLGALRERQKIIMQRQLSEVETVLKQMGEQDSWLTPEEKEMASDTLRKGLAKLNASSQLTEEMLAADKEAQVAAAKALANLSFVEAQLLTPQEGSPVPMSASEWTNSLQDSYLPGMPKNAASVMVGNLPSTKAASRFGSFFRNTFNRKKIDNSGYRGDLDKYSWYRKMAFSLEQWAKVNPHIKELQDYVNKVREYARDKTVWIQRADERLKQWRTLNQTEQRVLGRLMIDQTLEGKFFNLQDPAIIQKYPLSPRALEMYGRIKGDFADFLSEIESTLILTASKRLAHNPIAMGAEVRRIKQRFQEMKHKPYFPLSRFGEYLVIVRARQDTQIRGRTYKQGEVIHFEAFDTDIARKAELDRIKGMYPSGNVQQDVAKENVRSLMGMPTPILEAIKGDPNINLTSDQRKALDEYMYKIAPGQSFVKHLIQRKGIEGYSEDMMRSYSNYFFHGASHLGRIKHSQELTDIIKATDISADLIEGDATKRRFIANYMRRHFDYLMSPENDWSSFRGMVAVAYLAGVLRTAFINLSQVPLVTYPHLAAKYGDGKAIRELQKAYTDSVAMYRATKPLTKQEEEAILRVMYGQPLQPGDDKIVKQWSGLSVDELKALRQAVAEGFIDESLAMELAAMSEGSWLTRFKATSKAGYYWRAFSHYSMVPFQAAEKLNRRVTFMAAFRLAKQSGASFDQAFQAGREAVSASQYEYAKWNRAELLRGKKGVLFMFWQYSLNTMFFAFGGDKGWWRWWAMMLATAGYMGLPFAGNAMDIAQWALTKWHPNGQRINAQYELKKLTEELAEMLGANPDLLMHGISRFGFGLLPFADMSGSVSMSRPLGPVNLLTEHMAAPPNTPFKDTVNRTASDVGGATSALIMRMIQAFTQEEPDLLRRIERGMPLTFAQQMLTAARWYSREAAETMGGADLTKFDTNDPWQLAELASKGIGFQPRSIAVGRPDAYPPQPGRDEMLMKQDFANYWRLRRGMLLQKLDFEMEHGDTESKQQVMDAIRRYNSQVPSSSLGINALQIYQMRRGKEKSRALQEQGDAPQKMFQDLYNKIDQRQL